jgi:hypothetical protein
MLTAMTEDDWAIVLQVSQAVGPPMTLGNMREPGFRSLAVTCELCHHAVG